MGNGNFPVSDQLLVQYGQILPVSEKKIVKIGPKVGLKQENYIRKNFFWV